MDAKEMLIYLALFGVLMFLGSAFRNRRPLTQSFALNKDGLGLFTHGATAGVIYILAYLLIAAVFGKGPLTLEPYHRRACPGIGLIGCLGHLPELLLSKLYFAALVYKN